MKTLILMRHAKSSWKDHALDDHDRPLNGRGRRAAPLMARWLAAQGIAPKIVLCSSARRARETLDLMRAATPGLAEPVILPGLYEAHSANILDQLRTLPEDCESILLIGHQPSLGDLLRLIATTDRGPGLDRDPGHFPTAAIAVLEANIPTWSDLAAGTAKLTAFTAPRDLGSEHAASP